MLIFISQKFQSMKQAAQFKYIYMLIFIDQVRSTVKYWTAFKYIYMLIFIERKIYMEIRARPIQIHLHVNLYRLIGSFLHHYYSGFKYIYMLIFIGTAA